MVSELEWNKFADKLPALGELVLLYHYDLVWEHNDPPYWAFRACRWTSECHEEFDDFDQKCWAYLEAPEC